MKKQIFSATIVLLFCISVSTAKAQALIDFETGFVSTGYNDVRIPGNLGTRFSLKDDLTPKAAFFYRVRLNYTIKSRHTISLLYAPLETKSEGRVTNNILFEGVVFPANTELIGTYKFNSYRLTYRYDIVQKPKFEFGLGLTAKIRDAKIALASAALVSEKTNVGFVPIINFRLLWNLNNTFGILLEGDALAAPQGRAEDVQIAATYKFSDNFRVRAGYRILEGGAENDVVYNFALFHYASVGLSYTFKSEKASNSK
jgi:long-subunit fatty acid transport protein